MKKKIRRLSIFSLCIMATAFLGFILACQVSANEGNLVTAEELKRFYMPKPQMRGIEGVREGQAQARRQFQDIRFDFNSSNIQENSYAQLNEIGKAIKAVMDACENCTFSIEGHTDNVGNEAYNQRLSEMRAQAFGDYIVARFEIDKIRITAVGFGESMPVVSNETEAGRRQNRRVEIIRNSLAPGRVASSKPEGVSEALSSIERGYGGSYGEVVGSFFEIAGKPSAVAAVRSQDEKQIGPLELPALEVEIDVVKEVLEGQAYQARPMVDGDILTQTDNYKVQFSCNAKLYMYIAQLDSTGKMDPIFPGKYISSRNPVAPHTLYSIPPDRNWFHLDENQGVETIYFIASRSKRPDMEELFNELEDKNKSLVRQAPISLDRAVPATRGIGGVREGRKQTVNFQDGSQGQYSSTLFSSIEADFVVTRWFYHE